MRAAGQAVGIERRIVSLAVIAQAIAADQAEREAETPALPVRRELAVENEGVTALSAPPDIQCEPAEIRFGAFDVADRTRNVVVPGDPKPVGRAVIEDGIEMVDPVLPRVDLLLRRERRRAERPPQQREDQVRANK
jgi:hypothetical protein